MLTKIIIFIVLYFVIKSMLTPKKIIEIKGELWIQMK